MGNLSQFRKKKIKKWKKNESNVIFPSYFAFDSKEHRTAQVQF